MLREFVLELKNIIKLELGNDFDIRITHVVKNNGVDLEGMVILKKGENAAPTIYVNNYYSQYCLGRKMESIVYEVITMYKSTAVPRNEWLGEEMISFDKMQEKIIFRIVHYGRNKKELVKLPYLPYLDLAITFHCLVDKADQGIGTVRVTWELMNKWGVDMEVLWEKAKENTKRIFPVKLHSIEEVIKDAKLPMYVLTNSIGINGAAVILYEDALQTAANTYQSDFYILPSSIHEVILVPYQEDNIQDKLSEIVCDVNDTQVSKEEFLSNSVYVYKRGKGLFEALNKQ